MTNRAGETLVLAAKPTLEIISHNALGEQSRSSPAISDGEIFLRTYSHLWCISTAKGPNDGTSDTNAAVHGFASLGYALYHREKTGRGQFLDISMTDALFHFHEGQLMAHHLTNGEVEPKRFGAHHGTPGA